MISVRELRQALFSIYDQDEQVDIGGLLAVATGDPTLGWRLATLLADHGSKEAEEISQALGFDDEKVDAE